MNSPLDGRRKSEASYMTVSQSFKTNTVASSVSLYVQTSIKAIKLLFRMTKSYH